MKRERNMALCILYSILTCGLFNLYWMACINNEVNRISRDRKAPTGGLVIFLNIITCGIYKLFWNYSMGQKIDKINHNKNGQKGILYLVLGIVPRLLITIASAFFAMRIHEAITKFYLYHPYAARLDIKIKLSPLDLIILLIVLSIKLVIFCLMQNELNNLPESYNE